MKIKNALDKRVWRKTVLVNGESVADTDLKVFALKTGPRGYIDCFHYPYRVAKDGDSLAKYRIRASVEVIN